jgi:hypothetical protein
MQWPGREESAVIVDGAKLLVFRGSQQQCALFFADEPIALLWSDCRGSVGQMLAQAGTIELEANVAQMRWIADGNLDPKQPLATQIYPLLRLFENGDYVVRNYTAESQFDVIDYSGNASIQEFYPFATYIVTQPNAALDATRINHFRVRILNGAQPIVCCARPEPAHAAFVFDGHHKLAAYVLCKQPPNIVEIEQQTQSQLLPEHERQFLRTPHAAQAHAAARRRGRW